MKKVYFLLTLAASTLGVMAQTDPAADPNAPVMSFDKTASDYGTIKQGADGNREFTFTNTGKSPLVISEAHGSCGCTVPTYPKEPIMPGQKATIKVHYDTNRIGAFSKTVTVNSNAKNSPATLTISGTVEATAAETPPTVVPAPVTPKSTN
jgi:Protein of unknown function (DUF1573)